MSDEQKVARRPALRPGKSAEMPRTIGEYTVLDRIGSGAMGVVYRCTRPGHQQPVAVKVLTTPRHTLADVLPRFEREARATARLDHPGVVRVHAVGNEGEVHYIVMELIDGCSLDRLIGTPALTLDAALRLLAQAARALQAAHEAGVIHRDVKPSNILVERSGQPRLVDFGLAKSLHDGPTLSRSGDILGTPRYMSPEQVLLPPEEIDARTDIYSLGAVMYELLTGQPPVDGPNVMVMLRNLTDEEPVPVRERNPAVPEAVAAVCQRALANDREQRYPSAAAFAAALEQCVPPPAAAPQHLPAPPRTANNRPPSTLSRRPRAAFRMWQRRFIILLGLLLILMGVGLLNGWPQRWLHPPDSNPPPASSSLPE
ncbi:MAG: serine/threonine protein kinase [Planctomycetia bacterium]|nr:serine/threonine protein kinase [Planctomycetia bacterium]